MSLHKYTRRESKVRVDLPLYVAATGIYIYIYVPVIYVLHYVAYIYVFNFVIAP